MLSGSLSLKEIKQKLFKEILLDTITVIVRRGILIDKTSWPKLQCNTIYLQILKISNAYGSFCKTKAQFQKLCIDQKMGKECNLEKISTFLQIILYQLNSGCRLDRLFRVFLKTFLIKSIKSLSCLKKVKYCRNQDFI